MKKTTMRMKNRKNTPPNGLYRYEGEAIPKVVG